MNKYKRLSNREIYNKLKNSGAFTEFTNDAERYTKMKFDEVEDASYVLDINFDAKMADLAIAKGACLTDVLWASQVEFCSC